MYWAKLTDAYHGQQHRMLFLLFVCVYICANALTLSVYNVLCYVLESTGVQSLRLFHTYVCTYMYISLNVTHQLSLSGRKCYSNLLAKAANTHGYG